MKFATLSLCLLVSGEWENMHVFFITITLNFSPCFKEFMDISDDFFLVERYRFFRSEISATQSTFWVSFLSAELFYGNIHTDPVRARVCVSVTLARRDNSVLRQRTCAQQLSHVTSGDVIAELPPRLAGLWLSTRSV